MSSTTAPGTTAPDAASRIHLWDNARFIAVTLVVVGHAIQRMIATDDTAQTLYLLIYAFHMPAFAIISGFFSHAGPQDERRMRKVLTHILIPYLVFETIWTFVKAIVEGDTDFNPSRPSWTLWFLLALGIFRLILPYLALLRWPLLWAVLLSIGVGYLINIDHTFSLSRAIGILPFFVLGWQLREWRITERWRRPSPGLLWGLRGGALLLFAAAAAVLWALREQVREIDLRNWFFYLDSYADMGSVHWSAGLVRLGVIALAVVLSAAFFVLIPRSETPFSRLGQGTMYVYLLHSFPIYAARQLGLFEEFDNWAWLLLTVVLGVVLSVLLATTPVQRVMRPLVEPRVRWLFRAPTPPPRQP